LQIDKTVHMTMMCGCTLFLACAQKREPRKSASHVRGGTLGLKRKKAPAVQRE
jgi:hypothetical protein